MASVLGQTLKQDILNYIFRGASAPSITGPFLVSLHTGDPGTNRANEVSTGVWTNYARASVARGTGTWTAGANRSGDDEFTENEGAIDFGTAAITGTPPVITHVEVWDSAGTPRRIAGKALTTSKTINNGDPVSFADGAMDWDLNG